jgi:hypothetical protein
MAAYADYTFYSTTYLGTAIASADFARLALRASAVIDQITFNRASPIVTADTDDDTILAIQNATCAVAEEIQTQESSGNIDGVTSERVGNYSVSYGAGARAALSNDAKVAKVALLYLSNTELMYRGFASGELGGVVDAD